MQIDEIEKKKTTCFLNHQINLLKLINVYELRHLASCEMQCVASSLRVPCNCTMRCKKTTGNFVNLLKYEWSVQEGLIPSPPHADNTLRIKTLETILGQFKAKNTAVLSSPEPQTPLITATTPLSSSISNTMERIIKDGMRESEKPQWA